MTKVEWSMTTQNVYDQLNIILQLSVSDRHLGYSEKVKFDVVLQALFATVWPYF